MTLTLSFLVSFGLFTASTSSVSLPQNSKHTYGFVVVAALTNAADFLGTEVAQD